MQTWLVTGSSSGLGRAISEEALRRGHRVAATARREDQIADLAARYPDTCLALALDVTNEGSVRQAVDRVHEWAGSVDVLVNNAGYGIHGAIEEIHHNEVVDIFNVNVFGLLRVTRSVLAIMRGQGSGHIFNMSSIAGLSAGEGTGIYSATKFAVEGLSEALRAEVTPFRIRVTTVEPGPFRTEFNGRSIRVASGRIPAYANTAGRRTAALREGSGKQPGDPLKAARIVCDMAEVPDPPLHLLLGNAAVERVRPKLAALTNEIDSWESISRSADFDS